MSKKSGSDKANNSSNGGGNGTPTDPSPSPSPSHRDSNSGILDQLLFKVFHISDEVVIACFEYGRLMKTKFLLSQKHVATSHKLRKSTDLLIPYERLVQVDANNRSLTLKLTYMQPAPSASSSTSTSSEKTGAEDNSGENLFEQTEEVFKFQSLTSLKSIVTLIRQLHRIRRQQLNSSAAATSATTTLAVSSNSALLSSSQIGGVVDRELVINVEKSSKELKEDAAEQKKNNGNEKKDAAAANANANATQKKPSAISEKAKALDINLGAMSGGGGGGGPPKSSSSSASSLTATKILPIVLEVSYTAFIEREMVFGASEVIVRKPSINSNSADSNNNNNSNNNDKKKSKKVDKSQIVIKYDKISSLTIQGRTQFLTIEYEKKKLEFLAIDFMEVCKLLVQRCSNSTGNRDSTGGGSGGALKIQFEPHVESWADPVSIEKECKSTLSVGTEGGGYGGKKSVFMSTGSKPAPRSESVPSNVIKTTVVDLNEPDESGKLTMAKKTSSGARGGRRPANAKKANLDELATTDAIEV